MPKHPMVIYRGGYSGCYFATRRYKHLPTGGIQAYEKEDVTEQVELLVSERITEVFDALIAAAEPSRDQTMELWDIYIDPENGNESREFAGYLRKWLREQKKAMTDE